MSGPKKNEVKLHSFVQFENEKDVIPYSISVLNSDNCPGKVSSWENSLSLLERFHEYFLDTLNSKSEKECAVC